MLTPTHPWVGVGQHFFLLIFWAVRDISRTFDCFFDPLKSPLGPPPGVGQIFLGANQSHIYPNMCAKFGRGLTVVSKKGDTDTHTDTHTHRQRDAAALYSRLLDGECYSSFSLFVYSVMDGTIS